ncbi:hypothetical protein [Paenibacillus caui]|uniref:hypothetical protein n=1 Tax=Paenibacillus caui TaxID=2873927 RepID=UPI001CA9923A|nr:hypothetical protein [Paenibacillus caui]
MGDQKNKELEQKLTELLFDGEQKQVNHQEEGRKRLSPKYEIRIQTTMDPVVEETMKYRSMAREIDDRYDKYVERSPKKDNES